jgi:hypothetical protein
MLLDLIANEYLLNKHSNYYYDDNNINKEIILIEDWKDLLKNLIPFRGIYSMEI